MTADSLIKKATEYGVNLEENDRLRIERAFKLAEVAHKGQTRSSGEPYFNHVYKASEYCALYGRNADLIIAGLLHDTIEDTPLTAKDIENEFGADICQLVEGVTKLGKIKYRGNERHVESLRKFFISVANDARVVIVKLADRLHNLETLQHVRPDKQERIAIESIEIYSQLASRMGMGKLSGAIQDSAFPFAYPEMYKKTKQILEKRTTHDLETLDRVYRGIVKDLYDAKIRAIKIDKRVKGLYSLYKKIHRKNWDLGDVHDFVALRVVVEGLDECYRVLGLIHSHYKPVPGRIKDYIALPKPNGYQSLHTGVFAGDGNVAEIQIRTSAMHQFAEYGIASHHIYKKSQSNRYQKDSFNWIKELSQIETDGKRPEDFLKRLRTDFFQDRIFVYTPKGDVIDLPQGSTVIDFAFAVHTDIGSHASGAKINGKFSALKTILHNNDIVDVATDAKTKPTQKWLAESVSNLAHRQIRSSLHKQQ